MDRERRIVLIRRAQCQKFQASDKGPKKEPLHYAGWEPETPFLERERPGRGMAQAFLNGPATD